MCPSSGTCNPGGLITLVNGGDTSLSWQVNSGAASSRVSFPSSSGSIPPQSTRQVTFAVNTANLSNGWHNLGSVTVVTTNATGGPAGSITIPLWLYKGIIKKQLAPLIPTAN